MNIKPIKKSTLPDDIITQIKDLIKEGGLQPGDKLPTERELAEEFNVGRSTIRESLKALAVMGVIRKTQQGTFITDNISGIFSDSLKYKIIIDKIDFEELLETRKLLEVKMTGLAAEQIDNNKILQKMKNSLVTMREGLEKRDWQKYIEGDISFHNSVATASKNRIMAEIFNAISLLLIKSQKEIINQDLARRSLDYHKNIFREITESNVSEAEGFMLSHLNDIENEFRQKNFCRNFLIN